MMSLTIGGAGIAVLVRLVMAHWGWGSNVSIFTIVLSCIILYCSARTRISNRLTRVIGWIGDKKLGFKSKVRGISSNFVGNFLSAGFSDVSRFRPTSFFKRQSLLDRISK